LQQIEEFFITVDVLKNNAYRHQLVMVVFEVWSRKAIYGDYDNKSGSHTTPSAHSYNVTIVESMTRGLLGKGAKKGNTCLSYLLVSQS